MRLGVAGPIAASAGRPCSASVALELSTPRSLTAAAVPADMCCVRGVSPFSNACRGRSRPLLSFLWAVSAGSTGARQGPGLAAGRRVALGAHAGLAGEAPCAQFLSGLLYFRPGAWRASNSVSMQWRCNYMRCNYKRAGPATAAPPSVHMPQQRSRTV